jgi:hypothetical protein
MTDMSTSSRFGTVHTVRRIGTFAMALFIGVLAAGFSGTAQQSAVEALAGFDTPNADRLRDLPRQQHHHRAGGHGD